MTRCVRLTDSRYSKVRRAFDRALSLVANKRRVILGPLFFAALLALLGLVAVNRNIAAGCFFNGVFNSVVKQRYGFWSAHAVRGFNFRNVVTGNINPSRKALAIEHTHVHGLNVSFSVFLDVSKERFFWEIVRGIAVKNLPVVLNVRNLTWLPARANRGAFLEERIKALEVFNRQVLVRRELERCRAVFWVKNNSFVFNANSSAHAVNNYNPVLQVIKCAVFRVLSVVLSDQLETVYWFGNVRARQESAKVDSLLLGAPVNISNYIVPGDLRHTFFVTARLDCLELFFANA